VARLQWEEDRVRSSFEDIVSTALSLRYAKDYGEFQRLDGSGGDGGRDVQFRTASLLDLFEMKSFTGRLGTAQGRRAQVERSLERAAGLQPDSWTLVLPIDPTPEELQWFNSLRAKVEFPISWFGKTELDAMMAEFPVVPRYFVEGKHEEVVELLKEIAQERAPIGSIEEATERLAVLASRLDELSPHYRLDFERHGDATTIIVMPRYPGAEDDRPIVISGKFEFPETDVGQDVARRVGEFFAYGGEVEVPSEYATGLRVDAPGGLAPNFGQGGRLVLKSHPVDHGLPITGRIAIVREDDSLGPSMPVRLTKRVVGERGATLEGSDFTGAITIRLRADSVDHTANLNLSFEAPTNVLPGVLLQLYRFLGELAPPCRLGVSLAGLSVGDPMNVPPEMTAARPPEGLVRILEDLEFIQSVTATPFEVPDEIPSCGRRDDQTCGGFAPRRVGRPASEHTYDDDPRLRRHTQFARAAQRRVGSLGVRRSAEHRNDIGAGHADRHD
jgi:hypothetical protein